MTTEALEKLCQDARKRLAQFINRSTGQHLRAMREYWSTK